MTRTIQDTSVADLIPASSEPSWRFEWCFAIAVLGLALLSTLAVVRSPFIDPDEYYYATAAQGMLNHGDWITPHFNGQPRILKPILFYWIVAGAFRLFGDYVTVARLCSASAAAGGVLVVWLMGRYLLGRRAAMLAALFAAAHMVVAQMIRYATTDTTLWLFCSLANYAWLRVALPRPSKSLPARWAYLFFAAFALALLTKGPVALAWCFVPMLWLIFRRDWAALIRFRWASGILIVLLLVSPWAIPFLLHNARLFESQILQAGSSESYYHFGRPVQSLWQILPVFSQLLPSVFPLIPYFLLVALNPRRLQFLSEIPCRNLLVFWLVAILIILACANQKSFRYLLPLVAPTSLLLAGYVLTAMDDVRFAKYLARGALVYGIAMLVMAVPICAVIIATHHLDTKWLWLHLVVLLIAAIVWLGWYSKPIIHRLTPAMLVALIYIQGALVNFTASYLTGPTMASLAPRVAAALQPNQRLLLYGVFPRYVIFLSHRNEQYTVTPGQFDQALPSARACMLPERDWLEVPQKLQAPFELAGRCLVVKRGGSYSLDLSRDFEPVILMVHR